MHKRFVFNIVARILIFVSATMVFPLFWALYDNFHSAETRAFEVTIVLGITLGFLILWLFPLKDEIKDKVTAKDGLAIVGLSWLCLSFVGALPLFFSGVVTNYTDAFFEIASGFTTTGATIFSDIESLPRGILFWRSLTHWLGGMGIIVLYIALLPAIGSSAYQLYKAEAPGVKVERVEPRLKETAKYLWGIYFLFSFCEFILLVFGEMTVFEALCHTFGTMATGGFSTKNASLGAYSAYSQWVVILFMYLAGINFILHYHLLRGKFKLIFRNEEYRWYLTCIVVLTPIFAIILSQTGFTDGAVRHSLFQIISMATTTGYTTADFNLWPDVLKFLLVMLMFIGACAGSTGGGLKIIRAVLAVRISLRSVWQTVYPNAVIPVKFNKQPLNEKIVLSILSYFIIFVVLLTFGSMLFAITEACDLVTAFTAALSALSNIGPGLARVGATENFSWVSPFGKWLLVILMYAGRLELYSILILCLPVMWRK